MQSLLDITIDYWMCILQTLHAAWCDFDWSYDIEYQLGPCVGHTNRSTLWRRIAVTQVVTTHELY